MALHFEKTELAERRKRTCTAMARQGLDGLLMFQQESMYYLTGYDSFGFCFFQCLYLGADGTLALLTRAPDLRQAQHTSVIADIRVWSDAADAHPALALRAMLESLRAGPRLGIEADSYGLSLAAGKAVEAALAGFCTLIDASRLVTELRAVKSAAELRSVRRAAALADDALEAALAEIRPGADEGAILARMQGAVFAGGGDYPGNEFIIGSGRDALLCRYKSGRRRLAARDQITLEFAGVYRHYHAALMRTVLLGAPRKRHRVLYEAARAALEACEAVMRPGHSAGEVFAAHARVLDTHGLSAHRLNACGYSLGARFTPTWMDQPMFYRDNPTELVPGMVFFAHMILMDSDEGAAMCLGRSYEITAAAPRSLSRHGLDLLTR